MSNQITTVRTGSVALATNVSPWREAVNDEVGASFDAFLKFTKGDWTLGEEAKTVPADARFVVNLEEYYRGESPSPPQDFQRRTAPMLSVYDGRECIGFILRRGGGGAEAFTADDRSVGLFKDDEDAALELWRRARGQT
jgi:hypothetical protein